MTLQHATLRVFHSLSEHEETSPIVEPTFLRAMIAAEFHWGRGSKLERSVQKIACEIGTPELLEAANAVSREMW